MRKILKRWTTKLAGDSGVAGLVIAMVIMIVAGAALTVFFNKEFGSAREVSQLQQTNKSQQRLLAALFASYYTQTTNPRRIPCPDTDFNGDAESSCGSSGTATGTIPWKTLNIGQSEAYDAYGRYYTYAVTAAPAAREMCVSVGNDYNTSASPEYTGALVESAALEVRTTSQTAGDGRYVPFAIISHGANGYGAKVSTTVTTATTDAGASEVINSNPNTGTVINGPVVKGAAGFDDVVFAPSNADLLNACESLTPAQVANGNLSEDFNGSSAIDPAKFDTTGSTSPPTVVTGGDGVARFSNATSFLATATSYDFTPSVRPVYVSAYWTPSSAAGQFSIATRATLPPSSGDDFTVGVTFRFNSSGIAIREDSANINTPSAFAIVDGQEYYLEVYDSGEDVWARITRVSDPSTSATASGSTADDLSGDQRVVFINGSSQSDLDDVLIGVPMLVAEFNGSTSVAAAAAGTNMFSDTSPSLTVEAWVYPEAYPDDDGVSGTIDAAVVAGKWNGVEATAAASQGYRLYLNSGEVHLQIAGAPGGGSQTIETFDAGFSPPLNAWTHVAATYNADNGAVRFYKDGVLMNSFTSTITGSGTTGVNDSSALPFTVGADREGSSSFADYFEGRISDVRVWETARTQNEIRGNYNKRISANETGLIVNWRLDPTPSQGGLFAGDTVVATAGTGGTADDGTEDVTYGATLSRYFRPISSDFCPIPDPDTGLGGTRVGPYQCDFRVASTATSATVWEIDLPNTLQTLYAKLWGAGGGGYVGAGTRQGGDGGYTAGLIDEINDAAIGGLNLYLMAGEGGAYNSGSALGAGGGAGSVLQDIAGHVSLVAGGGGGASYSVNGVCSDEVNCGDGGGGGGAGSTMTRAFDDSTNCGGRGGTLSGSGPPVTGCLDGGADRSVVPSPQGSGGTSGATGGDGLVTSGGYDVSGGTGYAASEGAGGTVANSVGGGGGGGGSNGGEAGGFENGTASAGYGGGGGSGFAATDVSNAIGTSSNHAQDFSYSGGCELDITNNSNVATLRSSSCGTTNPLTLGFAAGMAVAGSDIPAGAYFGAVTTTTVTFVSSTGTALNAANGGFSGAITVTQAAGPDVIGGSTDDDYHPTYAASYPEPGLGGAGNAIGNPGAIVLKW